MSRMVHPEEQMHLRVQSLEKDLHTTIVRLNALEKAILDIAVADTTNGWEDRLNAQSERLDKLETILDDFCTRLEQSREKAEGLDPRPYWMGP